MPVFLLILFALVNILLYLYCKIKTVESMVTGIQDINRTKFRYNILNEIGSLN